MTWHRQGAGSRPDTQWELSDEEREARWKLDMAGRGRSGKLDPPAQHNMKAREVREMRVDLGLVSSDADWRAAGQGLALADFECRHGKMAHDRTQTCDCFMTVDTVLQEHVERVVSEQEQGEEWPQGVAELPQGSADLGGAIGEGVGS